MTRPSLARVSAAFFRIGNTTFGGGDPTMAALKRELVDRQRWIGDGDFALAYALARITPGTNVLAFCAATGAKILGIRGALAAVAAVTLPSAALAVLFTIGYEAWRGNSWVMAAISGTVAAVAGMMFSTVWLLVRPQMHRIARGAIIFGGAFVATYAFGITPIPVIGAAALAGFLWKES